MAKKTPSDSPFSVFASWLQSDRHIWIIGISILLIALHLRFSHINTTNEFGWDQANASWHVLDIIRGHLTLDGPRTGIGHMHLGPLYYYLLVPFFFLTHLDPIALQYENILTTIVTFIALFSVTKKIYGNISALFTSLIFSTCAYLINFNQTAWNVSLIPFFSIMIFYAIYQIYQRNYQWVFLLWILNGLAFHFHFTALFFPIISLLSLIFVEDKQKVFLYSLASIPLYLIWFIPTALSLYQNGESNIYSHFFSDYLLPFHLHFFLHRLPDAFIQLSLIPASHISWLSFLKFLLPVALIITIGMQKKKDERIQGYLFLPWFIVPAICFTLYSGPISDYYFIFTAPIVLFLLVYLQEKSIRLFPKMIIPLLILFWGYYMVVNMSGLWVKPDKGGYEKQKAAAILRVKSGNPLVFNEGAIDSYLYEIWTREAKSYRPSN